MSAAFTPGPWSVERDRCDHWGMVEVDGPQLSVRGFSIATDVTYEQGQQKIADARLIAAAPDLYDGCNAMLGLIQLLQGRDDLSAELREVLATNHRIEEAQAAVAKARGEQVSA